MDLEKLRRCLEKGDDKNAPTSINGLPFRFFDNFVMHALQIDSVEPGRVLCSFKVPPRLINASTKSMHEGAMAMLVDLVSSAAVYSVGALFTGVSVEINVSYVDAARVDDEIEIEAKALQVGKAVAVLSVELRNKKTGKLIAQGRHTKYIVIPSKI